MSRSCLFLSPAGEQQNVPCAALDVVDAIARPVVDPKLADTLADRGNITRIAVREPVDTYEDLGLGPRAFQLAQPLREFLRLADVNHARLYPAGYTIANRIALHARALRTVLLSTRTPMNCAPPRKKKGPLEAALVNGTVRAPREADVRGRSPINEICDERGCLSQGVSGCLSQGVSMRRGLSARLSPSELPCASSFIDAHVMLIVRTPFAPAMVLAANLP
jgi:hypothetical protein